MPMCTYIFDDRYTEPTTDAELNELLANVREATGEDWRIGEIIRERRRWFRRPLVVKRYTLFAPIGGHEFQIVNLYRPDLEVEWSMSTNDAGYVAAFLYGMLNRREPTPAQRRGA